MARKQPKTPVKALRRAIRRIERGWAKGEWVLPDKQHSCMTFCIEGSLGINPQLYDNLYPILPKGYSNSNSPESRARYDALYHVQQVLNDERAEMGLPTITPRTWNDSPSTTKDEVLRVMKLALIRAEADEAEAKLSKKGL